MDWWRNLDPWWRGYIARDGRNDAREGLRGPRLEQALMHYILIYWILIQAGYAGTTPAITSGSVEFSTETNCQMAFTALTAHSNGAISAVCIPKGP